MTPTQASPLIRLIARAMHAARRADPFGGDDALPAWDDPALEDVYPKGTFIGEAAEFLATPAGQALAEDVRERMRLAAIDAVAHLMAEYAAQKIGQTISDWPMVRADNPKIMEDAERWCQEHEERYG